MSTIEQQSFEWVARHYARGLSESERAQFSAWLAADTRHQGAYARALAIHNAISLATEPASMGLENAAREAANEPVAPAAPSLLRRCMVLGAMAACVAATVGTMGGFDLFGLRQQAVLTTAKGEFRKMPLQDKSVATINSGSRIEVSFSERQRTVRLRRGEAWFEVAKDRSKPFVVEAGDARIRAVGTAFAVRRYANGAEVLVTEGTVEVWANAASGARRLLVAGERAFLGAAGSDAIAVQRQPTEVNRKLAWREGKLILKNQTLGEAVADFNRYSPRTIVIRDAALAGKRLFGQYQLDAPELFARDVSTVLDVPLVITADAIYIGSANSDI